MGLVFVRDEWITDKVQASLMERIKMMRVLAVLLFFVLVAACAEADSDHREVENLDKTSTEGKGSSDSERSSDGFR